jgi:hypothetical protein
MEVRWLVVVPVHVDDDPVGLAEPRHERTVRLGCDAARNTRRLRGAAADVLRGLSRPRQTTGQSRRRRESNPGTGLCRPAAGTAYDLVDRALGQPGWAGWAHIGHSPFEPQPRATTASSDHGSLTFRTVVVDRATEVRRVGARTHQGRCRTTRAPGRLSAR